MLLLCTCNSSRTSVGSLELLEEGQRAAALAVGHPEMVGAFLGVSHYSVVPAAQGLSPDFQELSLRAEEHLEKLHLEQPSFF